MYDLNELSTGQKVELELILKAGYTPKQARETSTYLLGAEKKVSDEYAKEDITGDFEKALSNLIANIQSGEMNDFKLLYQWDKDRGTDWFTSTKLKELSNKG